MITHLADVVLEAQPKKAHSLLLVRCVVDRKYQSGDLPTDDQERLLWNIFAGGMEPESPHSPDISFVNVPDHDPEDLDFELHRDTHFDDGFEGLENVRACCDGRHTVGHSEHHHHGTVSSRRSADNQHLDPNNLHHENLRPSSLARSFRSRTGSTQCV